MSDAGATALPRFETILLSRQGRQLTITLNRPESMNAVNLAMHDELAEVFPFAGADRHSDVIVLTGAGRAFSAGGDVDHIARNAAQPELFDHEVRIARRIVQAVLDIDKPIVCRMNGHAVGLGATLVLLSDIIYGAEGAKLGDPHVAVGLVAGDGGAFLWPQRIGFTRAKEYLLTGELVSAQKAAEIGLINHCVPAAELDAAVDACCQKLLKLSPHAVRGTKQVINLELKRLANLMMDAGIALEALAQRTAEHRAIVAAMQANLGAKQKNRG